MKHNFINEYGKILVYDDTTTIKEIVASGQKRLYLLPKGSPKTLDDVREACKLQNLSLIQKEQAIAVKDVACEYFGIPIWYLDSKLKPAYIVRARHCAVWALIQIYDWRILDVCAVFDITHKAVIHIRQKLDSVNRGGKPTTQAPLSKQDMDAFIKLVKQKVKNNEGRLDTDK